VIGLPIDGSCGGRGAALIFHALYKILLIDVDQTRASH